MVYYKVFYHANNKSIFKFLITEVPEHLDTAERFEQARFNVSNFLKNTPGILNHKISHASFLHSDEDFRIKTVNPVSPE